MVRLRAGRLRLQGAARAFHMPALMISPEGVHVFTSEQDAASIYRRVMAGLPRGYAASEFPDLNGRRLSSDLAVVSSQCIWKTAEAQRLRRFGIMYTLRKVSDAWKIVSAVIHDAPTLP